jgi:hypothetical protein
MIDYRGTLRVSSNREQARIKESRRRSLDTDCQDADIERRYLMIRCRALNGAITSP